MPMAEDAHCAGDMQSFGEGREHLPHALSWRFDTVKRRVAASAEGRATRLAAERLDALQLPMCAIADERVDLRIREAIVGARWGGAGKALRGDAFGRAAAAFPLAPGADW
jgi:hypothetical protein